MRIRLRLKDAEAEYLGLQVKRRTEKWGFPAYNITPEQQNEIINLRLNLSRFITTQKKYDSKGKVISETKKRVQRDLVEIPKEHEILRLSTNKTTGQQWVITQPKKESDTQPDELLKLLTENIRPFEIERKEGNGTGVYFLSDFHMGAYVGKLIKTPDFNFGIIENYFRHFHKIIKRNLLSFEIYF